jgi:hypothetical protein
MLKERQESAGYWTKEFTLATIFLRPKWNSFKAQHF